MCQGAVEKALQGKSVAVLVNNVGMSYPYAKYYHELTKQEVRQIRTMGI